MDELGGILGMISEMKKLLDGVEKGLPSDKKTIPKGIIPSPEGSSFTESSLSPILSTTERSRVKQIADIFKSVLFPDPEARRTEVSNNNPVSTIVDNQLKSPTVSVGIDDKSKESLGILGSILGLGGGLGSAAGIAASALPILAAVGGVAAAIYTAGPASKLFAEALVTLSQANWDNLKVAGKVLQDFAYTGMDFLELVQQLGMDTIERFFNIGRQNMSAIADTVGTLGQSLQHFKDVNWDDLGKAGVAMAGLFGLLLGSGTPIIAFFQSIGAFVLSNGGEALASVGAGLGSLSVGARSLLGVFDDYQNLPLGTLAAGLGSLVGVLGTVGAAGIGAPLIAIGSLASQLAGVAIGDLAIGLEQFGKSLPTLANGLQSFEDVDSTKLSATSKSLIDFSVALLSFSASGFASSVVDSFSSIFGSSGFDKFLSLADRADKLGSAALSITSLKDAFKEFASIRTDHLAYNLESISNAVENLDVAKLKKIYETPGGVMAETAANEMRTIREYLLYGDKKSGNQYGLLGVQREILTVETDQLKVLKKLEALVVDIRNKIPLHSPTSGGRPVEASQPSPRVNNFRDHLKPMTLAPYYTK